MRARACDICALLYLIDVHYMRACGVWAFRTPISLRRARARGKRSPLSQLSETNGSGNCDASHTNGHISRVADQGDHRMTLTLQNSTVSECAQTVVSAARGSARHAEKVRYARPHELALTQRGYVVSKQYPGTPSCCNNT